MPLYVSTTFTAAWASVAAANLHALAAGRVEMRVSNLEVADARLLDLRGPALASLGLTQADLVSRGGRDLTANLVSRARTAGAEGLLVPSRGSSGGWDLGIFADALHRVTVKDTKVMELGLADATDNTWVRARFAEDEQLCREFARALEDGTFEDCFARQHFPAEETPAIRELAASLAP